MARYGNVWSGWHSESNTRKPPSGKNALIFEIVNAQPTSDVLTIYNKNATAYGTAPTDVTTGAAILSNIDHAIGAWASVDLVTGVLTTSTAIRSAWIKRINGPTTVLTITMNGVPQGGGSGLTVLVAGKEFV